MALDLTARAQEGWDRPGMPCPNIATSPSADAWYVGRHLRRNGAPRPERCATSRGQSVRINGTHVFRLIYGASGEPAIEAI